MKGMAAMLFMLLAVLSMAACSSAGTGADDMEKIPFDRLQEFFLENM